MTRLTPNFWTALLLLAISWPAMGAARVFDVRNHGAKGDGKSDDRPALQSALDACAQAGGGTVRLPPGNYLSGALRLAGGVTLHLEAGATLWASTNQSDYPTDCTNVTVRGVTILNSDAWTLHFKRCEDVTVEDTTIRNNYRRLNSDGIDPNSCRNVRIARCRISAGDDCIVLKSTEAHPCENVTVSDCVLESAASALKLGTESRGDFRDIRFANCVISNSPTGIGFYLKDGATMERVVFSNMVIGPCPATTRTVTPVFMDIERRHADSKVGRIRDVTFERLAIESGSGILAQGMAESPLERLAFRDVRFRVPQADTYAKRSKPVGGSRTTQNAPDARNTEFARLPSYFTVAHARELRVEHVQVEIAEPAFREFDRSAFCGRHIERGMILDLRRSPGPAAGTRPVVDLEDCRNVTVNNR
ncbi:MAG: glycosyl hydrolase family 28 protein [Verrucomicrobia bacterium]|nr:glycosyl hydrolase family 28 protein [Verrucomicrobiota bacterium]